MARLDRLGLGEFDIYFVQEAADRGSVQYMLKVVDVLHVILK